MELKGYPVELQLSEHNSSGLISGNEKAQFQEEKEKRKNFNSSSVCLF